MLNRYSAVSSGLGTAEQRGVGCVQVANQAKIARDALLEAELDHERTRSARDLELGGMRARLEREGGTRTNTPPEIWAAFLG